MRNNFYKRKIVSASAAVKIYAGELSAILFKLYETTISNARSLSRLVIKKGFYKV